MKNKFLLDSVSIKTPCPESWEEMQGTDEVRFCSHCAKNVHNLSAMTKSAARKLVAKSNGNLCIRYAKGADGKVQTVEPKFHQIKRAARIAAGVLGATLSISSISYAQQDAISFTSLLKSKTQSQTATDKIETPLNSISGKVFDPGQAAIPGAKITLRDTKNQKIRVTVSNDDGLYGFKNVAPSVYELEAESPGFKKLIMPEIKIRGDEKSQVVIPLAMEVGAIMGACVVIDGYSVELIQAVSINDRMQVQKLISNGKDVNEKEKYLHGVTALQVAAQTANLEIVNLLIKAKANVNISNDDGMTPLMTAVEANNFKLASILLKAGANPNLETRNGRTAYYYAKNEEIKNLLIRYKAAQK